MKTFIFLLFSVVAFAQPASPVIVTDSLKAAFSATVGDTVFVFRNTNANYKWAYIAYQDTNASSGAKTDSVQVFVSSGSDTSATDVNGTVFSTWVRVGVRSVFDGQIYPVITNTATNNTYRYFLINVARPYWIKIVLANSEYISQRRGRFVLRLTNEIF